ncbi:MAG TPA: phosphoglycerate mutase family protein [Thermoanaerobaculia bacterium]|nr:phosphoglycerate mutase family protein [Thermoanaerobaculia bacterium]
MRGLTVLLSLFAASVAGAGAPGLTTVILTRHAEKADASADTSLSAAGHERARELARALSGTPIAAIYTTQYARTRETAAPVAAAVKLTPVTVDAGGVMQDGGRKGYAAEVADRIRRDHPGQTVLVIGHSNTTRDVMKALGVAAPPVIEESHFDDLFVVTFMEGAEPSLVALRYGVVAR